MAGEPRGVVIIAPADHPDQRQAAPAHPPDHQRVAGTDAVGAEPEPAAGPSAAR